jgi:hypothetical protein
MNERRITISMTLIAVICFFLPWIQVSCGASHDSLSGVDLARNGHGELWLIPLLMIVALLLNVARAWGERRAVIAVANLVAGLVSAYLMNRERVRAEDTTGILRVSVTGWFWLGFASTFVLVLLACLQFLKRTRKT